MNTITRLESEMHSIQGMNDQEVVALVHEKADAELLNRLHLRFPYKTDYTDLQERITKIIVHRSGLAFNYVFDYNKDKYSAMLLQVYAQNLGEQVKIEYMRNHYSLV